MIHRHEQSHKLNFITFSNQAKFLNAFKFACYFLVFFMSFIMFL